MQEIHRRIALMYRVVGYDFIGFLQPVDNLPTVNEVKAGSSIPMKFSLNGFHGMHVLATGYPGSARMTCGETIPTSSIDTSDAAGGSGLSYDPATDRYTYVWKTEKSWKGSCRMFLLKLSDGSVHTAAFKLK